MLYVFDARCLRAGEQYGNRTLKIVLGNSATTARGGTLSLRLMRGFPHVFLHPCMTIPLRHAGRSARQPARDLGIRLVARADLCGFARRGGIFPLGRSEFFSFQKRKTRRGLRPRRVFCRQMFRLQFAGVLSQVLGHALGGGLHACVTLAPTGRADFPVLLGELQGVDHAQHLVDVAAQG